MSGATHLFKCYLQESAEIPGLRRIAVWSIRGRASVCFPEIGSNQANSGLYSRFPVRHMITFRTEQMKSAKERKPSRRRKGQVVRAGPAEANWQSLLAGALLFASVLIAYSPSMRAEFIWDDDTFLYQNPLIHASDGLRRLWLSTQAPDYFPLTSTTLWLEWRAFGMRPFGYHFINILLHAGSTVLLWRVLQRLRVPGAFGAALLFGLHPVCVESAAWITERKNTLSMLFYLAAVLLYLRHDAESRSRWYWLAMGAFLLALLSKSSVVMAPVILLILTWWLHRRITRADLVRSVPFFLLSGVFGLLTIWFQYNRAIATELVRADSFPARLAGAGWAVWFYLYKAVLPLNLSFVYPRWTVNAVNPFSWLPLLMLAAVFAVLVFCRKRAWAAPCLVGLGCFVVSLLPVLGFLNIYFMAYSLVSDHWQYIAIPAIAALATATVAKLLADNANARRLCLFTAAGIFFVLTWREQAVYHDVQSLWTDTLVRNPVCGLALNNLANWHSAQGRQDKALEFIEIAEKLYPNNSGVHRSKGAFLEKLDRLQEAEKELQEALRLNPKDSENHKNMGSVLSRLGQTTEALKYYTQAVELDPQCAEAYYEMGNVFMELEPGGNKAVSAFEKALQIQPDFVRARVNYGNLLLELNRPDAAEAQLRRAVALEPYNEMTRFNYGFVLHQLGKRTQAAVQFRTAMRLKPDWHEAAERIKRLGY